MNSYERTMSALNHENSDRVPVIPLIIQHALYINDTPHRVYSTNPQSMAESQIYSLHKYGYDGIHITTDNQVISEALGCRIYIPEDAPPQYLHRVLGDSRDLLKLSKVDPHTSARMPVILEATRISKEALKDEYFIKTNCDSGPFSLAAALRGEENLMIDMFDDEQFVIDLLEICSKVIIDYGKAIALSGAHAITFGDSTAGLIGRENYEKFAYPFTKYVVEELKKTQLPVFLHICGNSTNILDLMADTGVDAVEIDHLVDLDKAKLLIGKRVAIEGNVNPVDRLLNGTCEEVYEDSIKCIEQAYKGGGLILSSGCEVPRYTKAVNIEAMVRAARDFNYR
jgi:uroporphyrinogen decarboxylase